MKSIKKRKTSPWKTFLFSSLIGLTLSGCAAHRMAQVGNIIRTDYSSTNPFKNNSSDNAFYEENYGGLIFKEKIAQVDFKNSEIKTLYECSTSAAECTEKRNKLQNILLRAAANNCKAHQAGIFANAAVTKTTLDIGSAGLSGAASVISGATAGHLSAAGAFLTTSRSVIDLEVYQSQITSAIITEIDALQETSLKNIKKKQTTSIANYMMEEAIVDTIKHNNLCSFYKGVSSLVAKAGSGNAPSADWVNDKIDLLNTEYNNAKKRYDQANNDGDKDLADLHKQTMEDITHKLRGLQQISLSTKSSSYIDTNKEVTASEAAGTALQAVITASANRTIAEEAKKTAEAEKTKAEAAQTANDKDAAKSAAENAQAAAKKAADAKATAETAASEAKTAQADAAKAVILEETTEAEVAASSADTNSKAAATHATDAATFAADAQTAANAAQAISDTLNPQ
ncbi:MAG: hypothetical protein HQL52_00850 [Magnetococcales bacterium]|nr:hypothetical protein [Magnetococcales bacterium]